jgi:rubredoxin
MRCPNCGGRSIVKKVYIETEEGIKDRHHKCTVCDYEFFSYQSIDKQLVAEKSCENK